MRPLHILLLLLAAWTTPACAVDAAPEYALKAAFLFNFAKFIDWPRPPGAHFLLCTQGRNVFGKALDGLEGRLVKERPLRVQRLAAGESARPCQILFTTEDLAPRETAALHEAGVLIVGEEPGLLDQGGHIALLLEQDRVIFEVNLPAARRAGLALSSRLLRLARNVRQ